MQGSHTEAVLCVRDCGNVTKRFNESNNTSSLNASEIVPSSYHLQLLKTLHVTIFFVMLSIGYIRYVK